MALSNEEVIAIIEGGVSDNIKLARKRAKKTNMHITGKNVVKFLEKLDDYETYAQKLLREKLVKSNRSLFSFILRPVDKVFTAKGGSISYNLPQTEINELKSQISQVADGLDIKKYLKKVVKKNYVIDPNGVLFIDIDPDGMLETHVVRTENIFYYDNKGNEVRSIIFAPYKKKLTDIEVSTFEAISQERLKKEKDKLYYRVIDDVSDRIFVNDGGDIEIIESETLDNFFGFVPAIILGDEKNPNEDIYESIIADIIEDADALLRDVSTTTIHNLAHLYPRYWSYAQACTRCNGEGNIGGDPIGNTDPQEFTEVIVCPSCGGEGHKARTNPSDETIIPVPQDGDPILAPHLMGFESPDLETAKFYVDNIDKTRNTMFQAMWGTTYEQGGKRETATGRFLDAQPVQDRLRDISDTFAKLHKFMLDCYGRVILRNTSYQSSVSYGMRYILENPDDILKKYTETTAFQVSDMVLLDLRKQYLEAEYQNDPVELNKLEKLSAIEPFPTIGVKELTGMDWVSNEDKLKKVFYSEWVNSLTEAKKIMFSEERLRQDFENFINQKQLNNGTREDT